MKDASLAFPLDSCALMEGHRGTLSWVRCDSSGPQGGSLSVLYLDCPTLKMCSVDLKLPTVFIDRWWLSAGASLLAVLTHLLAVVDVSADLLELQFLWNSLLDYEFDPGALYLKKLLCSPHSHSLIL